MATLWFESIKGNWKGNDYPTMALTSVSVKGEKPMALVFMTHMNIDFDGAPNAYGPPEKSPLDSLANAGRYGANGYYGLVAVDPKKVPAGVKIDSRYLIPWANARSSINSRDRSRDSLSRQRLEGTQREVSRNTSNRII